MKIVGVKKISDSQLGWGLSVVDSEGVKAEYSFTIDNFGVCCESWDAEIEKSTVEFNDLVGKTISSFRFDDKYLEQHRTENDRDWSSSCYARLVLDDDTYILFHVSNDHNGCYPHEVTLINQNGKIWLYLRDLTNSERQEKMSRLCDELSIVSEHPK